MDLADALGQVNPALQAYGQVQKFQYEKGLERGEMEAATADLEQSIEGLDATGEKLVEQGLLPRSQLVGYQRAFRRRIGQRQARTTYMNALNSRMEEVTQNLDSDADIIENILAEERQKITEQLGGSQFAMQGFADYSESIENNFYTSAAKQRDIATQKYNESLVIEEANQDFGDRVLTAKSPNDRAQLQLDIKNKMDEIAEDGRIPRSRVIELYWNGFAQPNITNLLVGDNPQPDKAELILDSLLDIDLTGKGGKLGNINREGAKIRDNTVQLRRSIQAARDKIEKDQEENYRTITNLAGPALTTVLGGETGIPELDAIRTDAVKRLLDDTGGAFDEDTAVIAAELIKNKDADKLLQYMSFYNANEAKREAYGRAVLPLEEMAIKIKTRSTAILPQDDIKEAFANIDKYTEEGGTDIKGFINGGAGISDSPVINKEVVAYGNTKEVELEANTWFERSEIYPAREDEFESGFNEVIQSLYKNMSKGDVSDMVVREAAPFKERYNKLLKQKQIELKGVPNRDEEIIKAFTEIKEDVIGNFRDIKQAEKNYKESFLEEIQEDERFKVDPLTEITIEEGEEKLRTAVDQYYRYLQQKYLPFVPDDVEQRERELVYAVDLDELGKLDIDSRNKAWDKAGVIRSTIEEDTSGDTLDLEDTELLIHRKWGFRNPQEAIDLEVARKEAVLRIDFRETPYFETQAMLGEEFNLIRNEWSTYSKLGEAERNLDDFPIFKKWNRAFGVLTKEDINTVGLAQAELLKGIQ
jgi:hypothetical protein